MFKISAKEIANIVEGKIIGNDNVEAISVSSIDDAGQDSITFITSNKYFQDVEKTKASIVICPESESLPKSNAVLVVVKNPVFAFSKILKIWEEKNNKSLEGIDEKAVINNSVKIGKGVFVGSHVCIEEGVVLGDNVKIMSNSYIGKDTVIGKDSKIYPNVTIRENIIIGDRAIIHPGVVIGCDGFGFVFNNNQHVKVPQIGNIIIGDDVEIGANTTIDRATVGSTKIGAGTKIDNLVQIAHNVKIGKGCIICAQVGIAGSTKIGNFVTLAGQAGVIGHIEIGDGATVAGQGGVTKNVPAKQTVSGYPAAPHNEAQRQTILIKKLPELYEKIKNIEKKMEKRD